MLHQRQASCIMSLRSWGLPRFIPNDFLVVQLMNGVELRPICARKALAFLNRLGLPTRARKVITVTAPIPLISSRAWGKLVSRNGLGTHFCIELMDEFFEAALFFVEVAKGLLLQGLDVGIGKVRMIQGNVGLAL